MKKLLLTLSLVAALLGVQAQPVADNTTFLSLNAGASYYSHSGEGGLGIPAGGFYFGRWVIRPLAFRLAADVVMAKSHLQTGSDNTLFLMGSAEFMWDVNSTFFHVYNKNFLYPIPFYPLIGCGMVFRPEFKDGNSTHGATRGFQAMLGLHAPVRISSYWDAFLEYKCFFLRQTFDGSLGDNYMHTFTLGLTRRWFDNPFHRRSVYESRGIAEDWFFGIGIGPNFSSFAFEKVDKLGMYGIAPEITFGRNYSECWTIRFQLAGLTAHERYDTVNDLVGKRYIFSNFRTDLMFNVSNVISFTRGKHFNVLPYLGAGMVWRYDELLFDIAADAGVLFRYYLGIHSDLYADLRYMIVSPGFGGGMGGDDGAAAYYKVGLPSLTVGYIYNFGRSSTRFRMPIDAGSF